MKILFDQGTPVPLRQHLTEHSVDTAFELGWSNLRNSVLLHQAEEYGYELLITADHSFATSRILLIDNSPYSSCYRLHGRASGRGSAT